MRTRRAMDKNSVSESQGLGSIPSGAAFPTAGAAAAAAAGAAAAAAVAAASDQW